MLGVLGLVGSGGFGGFRAGLFFLAFSLVSVWCLRFSGALGFWGIRC